MKSNGFRMAKIYCWHLALLSLLILTPYATPVSSSPLVSGTLGAVGSDTMAGLVLRWGEALTARHPNITMQFQAGGSASAPAALIAGTTRLGPMSRPMNHDERQQFIDRYGYPPLELRVARDAIVVIVHRHAPLASLTFPQIDAIFSSRLACGESEPIRRWEVLSSMDSWPYGRIALHGRNLASGTHDLFQQRALCDGPFRTDISEYPGSSAVVAAVGESPNAIGYAGYHHLSPMVKAVGLTNDQGRTVAPSEIAIQTGEYPLSRDLYLYVNLAPGNALPAAEQALLALILSDEGQQIVRAAGFVPLPAKELEAQWAW